MSGIFIKNIIAGSSADKCGLLKVGDRILGNNTLSLEGRLFYLSISLSPFFVKCLTMKFSYLFIPSTDNISVMLNQLLMA